MPASSCSGPAVTGEAAKQLVLAADQFAITSAGRPTAVAGYPWFGEWSRDLMTSYEGLYLATGRHDEGREVLRTSAATVSEGMLANTADTGSLEYNTVDGTLWFVHAVGRHVSVTGDDDLRAELAPTLEQIVRHHIDGTRYGIRVDPSDGLLAQGAEGVALTWMDARIGGVPVTPRAGKPVEVNALWLRTLDLVPGFESLRARLRPRRSCDGSCARTASGSSMSSTVPRATTARSGPISCSPCRCRTARSTRTLYAPSSTSAVDRC